MKLFHENPIFETVKSKVIISLFETVRLSVSISPRNLYNSLKSIKEKRAHNCYYLERRFSEKSAEGIYETEQSMVCYNYPNMPKPYPTIGQTMDVYMTV